MSSISSGAFGSGGGGGVGNVKFLQGNDSVPVGPNPAGIIFTNGAGTVFTTGNAGTFTETFHVGNGTAGQILTSAGAGADAVWAAAPSAGVTIAGDSGTSTGTSFTFLAQSTADFAGPHSRVSPTWAFTNNGSGIITQTATDSGSNTFVGGTTYTLQAATISGGVGNTGMGSSAFSYRGVANPASFTNNTAFGSNAGAINGFSSNGVNPTVDNNSYFGSLAGNITTPSAVSITLENNSFFGFICGRSTSSTTGYSNNSAFGYQAMGAGGLTTATNNCAFGMQSLQHIKTGTDLIAIGFQAGTNYTTSESNNIIIGNGDLVGDNFATRIGYIGSTPSQTSCFIDGIDGITVTGAAVLVATGGQLGVAVSSAKYKDNIQDMGDASSKALDLRPVTFSYKGDTETRFGLIAEEVAEVLPELVVYDPNGDPQTVMYHELPALLLNELKKALKRIEALEARS